MAGEEGGGDQWGHSGNRRGYKEGGGVLRVGKEGWGAGSRREHLGAIECGGGFREEERKGGTLPLRAELAKVTASKGVP